MDLALVLMPALVLVFGPRQAVPIMAVAAIMANASRVAAWWREVDWRATAAYSVTGVQRALFFGARSGQGCLPGHRGHGLAGGVRGQNPHLSGF